MWFQENEINVLLQSIQENSCKDREIWFNDVRSSRRRKQHVVDSTPVARLFTTPDQYHELQKKGKLGCCCITITMFKYAFHFKHSIPTTLLIPHSYCNASPRRPPHEAHVLIRRVPCF